MTITKDIIQDLIPLYVANECSADSRALVDGYLKDNPGEAEMLRRIMTSPILGFASKANARGVDEVALFREARRRLRRSSWLKALAICFSLAPFSFMYDHGKFWVLFREAPVAASVYAALAVTFWVAYAMNQKASRSH